MAPDAAPVVRRKIKASPLCPVPFPQKPPALRPKIIKGFEGPVIILRLSFNVASSVLTFCCMPQWNFNKIALPVFNLEQYERYLTHPHWTLQETIVSVRRISVGCGSDAQFLPCRHFSLALRITEPATIAGFACCQLLSWRFAIRLSMSVSLFCLQSLQVLIVFPHYQECQTRFLHMYAMSKLFLITSQPPKVLCPPSSATALATGLIFLFV